MGKKKKNKGGTGSEYFDYAYGVGEAKHMMKRYGVKGAKSVKPSAQTSVSKSRGVDDVKDDIAKAMMNDYDTRRTMEAAAMAGNKDAKKYAKKGFKAGNIQDAYGVMRDLKKEYVGGGGMDGAENRAGLTFAAVKADRDKQTQGYRDEFASKTDLEKLQEEQQNALAESVEPKETKPSEELESAKSKVQAWESGRGGDASSVYGNSFYDKSQAEDEQTSASVQPDSFLAAKKAELKKERNLKRAF